MLLNDIRDRILNGASFDELAQEYSDDPALNKKEGILVGQDKANTQQNSKKK